MPFALACSSSDASNGGGPDGGAGDAGSGVDASTHDSGAGRDGGAGSDGGDSGGGLSCDGYCAQVIQNCAAGSVNAEYTDLATCTAMCSKLTLGSAGDTSGDTIACRAAHAASAAGDPATNCKPAGPNGGGVCGTDKCIGFCELAVAQCPAVYATQSDCMTACAAFPIVTGGDINITSGDSFNCRMYHLEAAYAVPTTHCPHVAATSAACHN